MIHLFRRGTAVGQNAHVPPEQSPTVATTRTAVILLGVGVLLALAGCSVSVNLGGSPQQGQTLDATVTHVVDGDTIDVRYPNGTTETVRLLGIDTPEVHVETQPGEFEGVPDTESGRACLRAAGENASRVVQQQLAGERVTLRLDHGGDARGGYGRLLAIVVHEHQSVNLRLIEDGHARLYDTDFSERDRYAEAEREAMAADRGLWQCRSVE